MNASTIPQAKMLNGRTRRCEGQHCGRRVLGNSSFRFTHSGGRSSLCKFCEEIEDKPRQLAFARYASLCAQIKRLKHQLVQLEADRDEARRTSRALRLMSRKSA